MESRRVRPRSGPRMHLTRRGLRELSTASHAARPTLRRARREPFRRCRRTGGSNGFPAPATALWPKGRAAGVARSNCSRRIRSPGRTSAPIRGVRHRRSPRLVVVAQSTLGREASRSRSTMDVCHDLVTRLRRSWASTMLGRASRGPTGKSWNGGTMVGSFSEPLLSSGDVGSTSVAWRPFWRVARRA